MYYKQLVSVVVPCYNEAKQIGKVLTTIPEFVDKIIVVDDASKVNTYETILKYQEENEKIILIKHEKNQGVGGAIATGYKWSRDNNIEVAVVMAGDGQMDPEDLPDILDPIVENKTDYTKGNRLFSGEVYNTMPKLRFYGNAVLSLLTKIASGYWHVADSQSGYTAANQKVLKTIDWDKMYKKYGQPNDLLVKLNIYDFRVRDVAIKPLYNIGEQSGIKIHKIFFTLSWLLIKLFFFRLKEKYVIRNFHPLIFFYFTGFVSFLVSSLLLIRLLYYFFFLGFRVPDFNFVTWLLTLLMSMQFTLFAMWFDMQSNKDLK